MTFVLGVMTTLIGVSTLLVDCEILHNLIRVTTGHVDPAQCLPQVYRFLLAVDSEDENVKEFESVKLPLDFVVYNL
jgi:hypothetical protein